MSWIFGAIPKTSFDLENILLKNLPEIAFQSKKKKFQIYGGGLSNTIHFSNSNDSPSKQWIVSGVGIQLQDKSTLLLQQQDWNSLLNSEDSGRKIRNLDGHHVIVQWDSKSVSIITDRLGLRDIYLVENEKGIFFSTNPIWLKAFVNLELDFSELGSHWLLFNQISNESIFRGTKRITAGQKVTIGLEPEPKIEIENYDWLPSSEKKDFGINEFSELLYSLININLPKEQHLSLSLSGGMDSRLLLSYLVKENIIPFDTHTFGNPNHPDSKVAHEIVERLGLEHHQFNIELDSIENLIEKLADYSSRTLINTSVSAFIQLNNYSLIDAESTFLIDGTPGEIWRREFFYKLYLQGKQYLLEGNVEKIVPFLKLERADIFNDDANNEMIKGVKTQLKKLLNNLPPINEDSLENWLDLFAIKTKIPNNFSPEQTRLDNYVISVMPFIQPSLLENLFNMKVSLRQNRKLFREIINRNAPVLKKFSLVKGVLPYPYSLNTLQSRIWIKTKQKLKLKSYTDNNREMMLNKLKEFILDTINSQDVKETPYYNYSKIGNIVKQYYKGDTSYSYALDWWLSFELFRKEISK